MSRFRWVTLALSTTLIGCATSKPITMSGPAPVRDKALECVLRESTAQGFEPMAGGVADGYVKLGRKVGRTAANTGAEVATRVYTLGLVGVNHTTEEWITATGAASSLRVTMAGVNNKGHVGKPTDDGLAFARQLLAACGSDGAAQ